MLGHNYYIDDLSSKKYFGWRCFYGPSSFQKRHNKFEKTLANGLEMAHLSQKMVNCDPTSSLHLVCYRYPLGHKGFL